MTPTTVLRFVFGASCAAPDAVLWTRLWPRLSCVLACRSDDVLLRLCRLARSPGVAVRIVVVERAPVFPLCLVRLDLRVWPG